MPPRFFIDENISDSVYANDNVYNSISGGGAQLKLRISPNGARLAIASFNIVVA